MGKQEENAKRLRYIRALERFHIGIVNYLSKSEDLTKEKYNKKVLNSKKLLDRCEKVQLYKGEYSSLESLITKIISEVEKDNDIDEIKKDILYQSNQLQKSINKRKYKKDKHQNSKFNDWE